MYCGDSVIMKINANNIKAWGCNNYHLGYEGGDYIKNIITLPIKRVKEVFSSGSHTIFLMKDGTVKGCGNNMYGQLGFDVEYQYIEEITELPINNVKNVFLGDQYTIFLMKDNTIKGCGLNDNLQLGLPNEESAFISEITTIPITDVKEVYCNESHTFFLLNNLKAKGCGNNKNKRLGLTDEKRCYEITDIPNIDNITNIYCTEMGTFFITNSGSKRYVCSCGSNLNYQLGLFERFSKYEILLLPLDDTKSIYCNKLRTFFLNYNGTVKVCGGNYNKETGINGDNYIQNIKQIQGLSNVDDIFCGQTFTLFLMKNGTVKGCGKNEYGQLGLGDTMHRNNIVSIPIENVKQIVGNDDNVFFILKNGTVMGCGRNNNYELGLGDRDPRYRLTKIPNLKFNFLKFLIKQDNDFYSIKQEFHENGLFKPVSKDNCISLYTFDNGFDDISDYYDAFYSESENKYIKPIDMFKKDSKILICDQYNYTR